MPSVGTDGETKNLYILYFFCFLLGSGFAVYLSFFKTVPVPVPLFIRLKIQFYFSSICNCLAIKSISTHVLVCIFFIDKIVAVYNSQTKFDLHSSTFHRQRAMQTSITQDDGVHHFMVSFKGSLPNVCCVSVLHKP